MDKQNKVEVRENKFWFGMYWFLSLLNLLIWFGTKQLISLVAIIFGILVWYLDSRKYPIKRGEGEA